MIWGRGRKLSREGGSGREALAADKSGRKAATVKCVAVRFVE